jgi:hypothetical protein
VGGGDACTGSPTANGLNLTGDVGETLDEVEERHI